MKTKLKALEPLIASILLIVVAVILVTIVLTWGKNFTTQSVSQTTGLINHDILSDKQSFMKFVEAKNGMYTFDYYPPNTGNVNFKVVGYSLLGYNDYIPLEPEKEIIRAGKFMLPLGIVNEEAITISLLLEDGSYLTFKNIKNINLSPSQSDCPQGFVPVPGNHLYGTVGKKGGFCVMQYEAKIDENGDGIGDINTTCKHSTLNTWDANKSVACNITNKSIVSTPEGYPISRTTQNHAKAACESIDAHLITNEEWMTLARNIEIINGNWVSGKIGVGALKTGNIGLSKCYALDSCYDGSGPDYGIDRNELAKFKLTNNQEIWDISGNLNEWVDKEVLQKDEPDGVWDINGEWIINNTWFEYTQNGPQGRHVINTGSLMHKDLYLLNSSYNNYQGVGRIMVFSDPNSESTTPWVFVRGGGYTYGGLLHVHMNDTNNSVWASIGFRCAFTP